MGTMIQPPTEKAAKPQFELGALIAPDGIQDPRYLLARESFWEYCKLINPKFFKDDRTYLNELADDLQAFYERRLINPKTGQPFLKFMMNLPPRHGKSYILTLLCQWLFGKNFLEQIITVSYNETLSGRFARSVRDGIDATKGRRKDHDLQRRVPDGTHQVWRCRYPDVGARRELFFVPCYRLRRNDHRYRLLSRDHRRPDQVRQRGVQRACA